MPDICSSSDSPPARTRQTLVHRQVSFELAAFDLLKAWQRRLQAVHGRVFTNSEVLSRLILSNPWP
jgi:hypothetical protein